ncbi:hypothetical protein ACSSS7_005613 [Eimeria intestinalis]
MWGPQTLEGPPSDFGGPAGGPLSPFGKRSGAVKAAPGSSSSLHQPAAASPSSLQGLLALDVDTAIPPPPPAAPPPPPASPPPLGAPFDRGAPSSRGAGSPKSDQGFPFSPSPASPGFLEAFSPTKPHASVLCDQQGGPSESGAPSQFEGPLWASPEAWETPSISQGGAPMAFSMTVTPPPSLATETVSPRSPSVPQLQQPQQQAEQQHSPGGQLQQTLEGAASKQGADGLFSEQQRQQPDADLWRDWQQTPHFQQQQEQQEQQIQKQHQQHEQQPEQRQDEQKLEEQQQQQQEQQVQLKRQQEQQRQEEEQQQKQQQKEQQQQHHQREQQQEADQQQDFYGQLQTPPPTPPPSLASLKQQPQSTLLAERTVAQLQQQHQQLEQQLDELWGRISHTAQSPQQQQQQQEQQDAQLDQQQPQEEQREEGQLQQRRVEEQPQQQEQQQQRQREEQQKQQQQQHQHQQQLRQAVEQEVTLSVDEFPSETALGPPRSLPATDASVGAPEAADWDPPNQGGGESLDLRGAPNFVWKPLSVDTAHADLMPAEAAASSSVATPPRGRGAPLGPSPCPPSLSPAAAPDSLWHPPHTPIPDTSTAEAAAAAAADAAAGSGSNASLLGVRITADSGAGGRLQQQTPCDGEGGGSPSLRSTVGGPLIRDLARTPVGVGASRLSGDLASAFSPPKRIREGEPDADGAATAAAAAAGAADPAVVSIQSNREGDFPDGEEDSAATAAAAAAAANRATPSEDVVDPPLGSFTEATTRAPNEIPRAPQPSAVAPAAPHPDAAASHSHGRSGGAASRLLRALPFGLGALRGGTPKQQRGEAAASGDTSDASFPQATTEFERLLKEAPGPAVFNGAPQANGGPSPTISGGAPEASSSSPQGAPSPSGLVGGVSGSPLQEGPLPGAPQAGRYAGQHLSPGEAAVNGASSKEGSRVVVGGAPVGAPGAGGSMGGPLPPQPSVGSGASPGEAQGRPRTPYNLFLERLKHPACAEVVSLLRRFVEGFPAAITRQEAADLLHAFITKAQARLLRTEVFSGGGAHAASGPPGRRGLGGGITPFGSRDAGGGMGYGGGGHTSHGSVGEGEAAEVGEGLERFLIQKLFAVLPKETSEDRQEDVGLERKMRCLAWVEPQHLEIRPLVRSTESQELPASAKGPPTSTEATGEGGGPSSSAHATPGEGENTEEGGIDGGPLSLPEVQLAGLELGRIDRVKAPRDKIRLILSACKLLISVLEKARRTAPAADDLLPLLIYTVIKTRPPRLHSNIQFVAAYRHPARMQGEEAYFFTHFCSAAAFIKSVGSPGIHFNVDPSEYERRMAEAEKALQQQQANGTLSPAASVAAVADRKVDAAAATTAVAEAAGGGLPSAAGGGTGSALAAAATALSTLEQLHPNGGVGASQGGGAIGQRFGFRGAALLHHAGGAPLLHRQRQLQQQQTRLLLAQLVRVPRTFQTVRTAAHLKVGDLEGLLTEYQDLLGVMDRAAVLLQQQLQLDQDCSKLQQQQQTASSDAST